MDDELPVSWFPAHPYTGSVSMQRYWKELTSVASELGGIAHCPFSSSDLTQQPGRLKRAWGIYASYPRIASKVSTKLVHILDQSSSHLIPFLSPDKKIVVTVHDIFPLLHSDNMSPFQHWRLCRRLQLLTRADKLIADSEFTKSQLIEELEIPESKICVIYLGYTALSDKKEPDSSLSLPDRNEKTICLLSVGNTLKRKNLEIIPHILFELTHAGYTPLLIRAGDMLPDNIKKEIIRKIGEDVLHEYGRIDDASLNTLYEKSDLLLFPSWGEGFGLPVLEAMGKGCPVVSSSTTSLPEVGGEAALYFDPHNPSEACKQIISLQDAGVRNYHVNEGFEQVKKFTWENHLQKVIRVYENVLKE